MELTKQAAPNPTHLDLVLDAIISAANGGSNIRRPDCYDLLIGPLNRDSSGSTPTDPVYFSHLETINSLAAMLQIQYCTIDTFKSQSVAIILGLSPSLFGTTAGNIRFMHEQLYTIMAPKLHGPLACDSYPIFRQKIGLRFARYHTTSTYFLEMENFQLFNTLLTQLGNQTNLVLCGCPIHFVPFPAKDDMPTMISQLDQREQVLSGHVALRLSLIWPFTQNNHDTIQKMKHLAGYAPIMSYPYCWQPQEPSLFLVYFKSNHVTNQYNNLSPDKFMPLSLLLVMPTMNHEEYPTPQEAATRGGAIAMDADDSDETTLDTSETRSAK